MFRRLKAQARRTRAFEPEKIAFMHINGIFNENKNLNDIIKLKKIKSSIRFIEFSSNLRQKFNHNFLRLTFESQACRF